MVSLPKDENQNIPVAKSGEIFSQESPYEEVVQHALEEETNAAEVTQEPEKPAEEESQLEPPAEGSLPPPPFTEDKRKKFLLIFFIIILIFLLFFIIISLFRKFTAKTVRETNISLIYWGLWEDKQIVQPLIDEYQREHKNITINYLRQDPKQYRERLQAAIDRGEGPDIFRFHNTWLPMMLSFLTPVPKTVYTDSDYDKLFYQVIKNDLKSADNYWGIPLMIDGLLLYYNEDILKSANVEIPKTWVDLQNAVAKITVKEKEKLITSAVALGEAENIEHFSDILGLMMWQNGTQLTKSLLSCSDPQVNSCSIEALTFYRKFADEPNNTWDETQDNSIVAFAGGKVAMIFAPSWQFFTIKKLNPDLSFKIAQVPQLPCNREPCPQVTWATYWVEGVSVKSKNAASSWDFLKFLSRGESLQKLYSEQVKARGFFGEPYPQVELSKTLIDNEYLKPLILSAPSMKSFYFASRTYDGETGLNSTLISYLKDAVNSLRSGVSPETALATAQQGFQQVYSRFGLNLPSN